MKIKIVVWMCLFPLISSAQVNYHARIDGVTTYVWRGIKQFNGAALQMEFSADYRNFTVGFWASSLGESSGSEIETDPFIQINVPLGKAEVVFGTTLYSYDFFKALNTSTVFEAELFAGVQVSFVNVKFFFEPFQPATRQDLPPWNYWSELEIKREWHGFVVQNVLALGTYSSRFLKKEQAVSVWRLSILRYLTQNLQISWNYSHGFAGLERVFWLGVHYQP